MGRARLALAVALAALASARPARALPWGISVAADEGIEHASKLGVGRSDARVDLCAVVEVQRRVLLRLTLDESGERLSPGLRLGALVRPWLLRRLSPYVFLDTGLVAASTIDTLELRAGAGVWWHATRWIAVYAEIGASIWIARTSQLLDTITVGVAIASPRLW